MYLDKTPFSGVKLLIITKSVQHHYLFKTRVFSLRHRQQTPPHTLPRPFSLGALSQLAAVVVE